MNGSASPDDRQALGHGISMNVYSPAGTKVIFRGAGGSAEDVSAALASGFVVGQEYVVECTHVARFMSSVRIEGMGHPNDWWNTVLFEDHPASWEVPHFPPRVLDILRDMARAEPVTAQIKDVHGHSLAVDAQAALDWIQERAFASGRRA